MEASEETQSTVTETPLEIAAEIPPDEEAVNPPDQEVENPPEDGDKETGEAEITAGPGDDDSVTELPSALQGQGQDDDAPFPETAAVPYIADTEEAEPEDMEGALGLEDRPPPMAPGPAIFYRDESPGLDDVTGLGSELMVEHVFKKEAKRVETAVPAEKKPERPKRVPNTKSTFPFRARMRTDAQIEAAMRKVPARHEYCGFIYSSLSQRPQGGYTNYFLPVYGQPRARQHVQISGLSVPMDKVPINKELPKDLLPLSTVKVTWSSNRRRTVYRPESIYAYLSRLVGPLNEDIFTTRQVITLEECGKMFTGKQAANIFTDRYRFGPIDAVYPKSVNSAYVIFSDLEAARACIQCTDLGRPWDPLIAFWVEPRMYNSGFYYRYATAENLPIRVRM